MGFRLFRLLAKDTERWAWGGMERIEAVQSTKHLISHIIVCLTMQGVLYLQFDLCTVVTDPQS